MKATIDHNSVQIYLMSLKNSYKDEIIGFSKKSN